jgi:hypothetical protein
MLPLPSRRALAIGAVVLVSAAGGGAAVAATTGASTPNDFLDSVAQHLGISRQKLDDATKAAAIDQVNADLAAGRITKAQADERKQRIQSGDVPPLGGGRGPGGGGRGFGGGPGGRGFGGLLRGGLDDATAAAAKYLGLSESDLQSKLRAGQSLADVAKAQGKDLDGLKQAILAAAKSDLDKAVSDKKLTQSQADDVFAKLKGRIDDAVNGKLPGPGGRRVGPTSPGGPHGFGVPFGADASAAAKYLGLSEADLRAKLRAGQSLADVAKAQSKDLNGLQQALVDATKAQLDKAVADKKLTQSQADDILANVKSRIADVVNAKPGARRDRRGPGPGWFGP